MLPTLIAKDFRRMARNPWPWLLNLALPLLVTGIIGLAFAPRGDNASAQIARIKLAIVDEDQSLLSGVFRSLLTQEKAIEHLDPLFLKREEALRTLRENQISAILLIPTNFGSNYIRGESGLQLQVIKNPAQSIMPAIVEELASVGVSGLNAISRNLNSEFPGIRAARTNNASADQISESIKRIGDRLKNIHFNPPLVSYEKIDSAAKPAAALPSLPPAPKPKIKPRQAEASSFNIFAYILPGMASAFLLFIADQSMRDFHREVRMKTLDRQRTAGCSAGIFITGKILVTALSVMIGATILFTAGSVTFGIHWAHPDLLALACVGYSIFGAGFMAALASLAPSERRADVLNSTLLFTIAFLGGSYLPPDNFPRFMREHISTLMPNYWLIETVRSLQRANANSIAPLLVVAKLTLVGLALGAVAAIVIERRLTSGSRA
jgi:ABC-type multidrug transport system permease subunit